MSSEPDFDVDNLFQPRYDYEPLKRILLYLLRQDKDTKSALAKLASVFPFLYPLFYLIS